MNRILERRKFNTRTQLEVYIDKTHRSGKEAEETKAIDESKIVELTKEFRNTYFEEVYKVLRSKFKLGRVRILLKEPRSTLSYIKIPSQDCIFQL